MTRQYGPSPRVEDDSFVAAINDAGSAPGAAQRFAAALDSGGDDLARAVEALAGELPGHIREYFDQLPQYTPVFTGLMRAVAADDDASLHLSLVAGLDVDVRVEIVDADIRLVVRRLEEAPPGAAAGSTS